MDQQTTENSEQSAQANPAHGWALGDLEPFEESFEGFLKTHPFYYAPNGLNTLSAIKTLVKDFCEQKYVPHITVMKKHLEEGNIHHATLIEDYGRIREYCEKYQEEVRLYIVENRKLRKIIVGLSFLVVSLGGALIWRL